MRTGTSRKLAYLVLALCLVAMMLSFACAEEATPAATAKATPAASPIVATTPTKLQPKSGGTFRLISSGGGPENLGSPASVSPRLNPFAPYPAVEHLVHFDESGLLVPFLASGWKWSADYLSLTITLNKGIKFHDGTDLNAAAAKYCLDLIVFSAKAELKSVTSIEVIDDYTLKMNLKAFDNTILVDLGTVSGLMVSPTALKTAGEEYNVLHPVGTGGFKFVSYSRDVSLKFEKFKDYWQKGKPYFDAIETLYMADAVTAKASFLGGEGDALICSPVNAAELQKKGFNTAAAPTTLFSLAGDSSHTDSQFAKLEVRQALSYAIDSKAIVDAIGYGFFKTANQAAYPGLWSYNPNVAGYSYNPQKAKQLLTAAGYPDGFKTTLTYSTQEPAHASACAAIQRYLSDVGINAELVPLAPAKFTQVMQGGWNGIIVCNPQFPIGYSPLNTISKNVSARGNNFKTILHPANYEEKLNQAFAEPDQDKMAKLVQDVQKMMIDDYCLISPIYVSNSIVAEYKYVHDVQIYDPFGSDWRPYNGWLDK